MDLLLTLGHNSSALTTTFNGAIGYEEERLTRVKSDSRFPRNAIEKVWAYRPNSPIESDAVYISHWFDNFEFIRGGNQKLLKYFDTDWLLDRISRKSEIITLDKETTHHDAHAWSAVAFYEYHADGVDFDGHVIVADGFGNRQEVFSIYRFVSNNQLQLVNRMYGYAHSLGLLYQYATSWCYMKENQDEYKFLGYQSHIRTVAQTLFKDEAEHKISHIGKLANNWAYQIFNVLISGHTEPSGLCSYIDVDGLEAAKIHFYGQFDLLFQRIGLDKASIDNYELRTIIGHYIQEVIENFYTYVLGRYQVKNLMVVGGLHYNVKLNNHAYSKIKGTFCACPLAGDQGGAIGLYRKVKGPNSFPFYDLKWGLRYREASYHIKNLAKDSQLSKHVIITETEEEYVQKVVELLLQDRIVNTIDGSLEFGPRALCSTSTLAVPTRKNVDTINQLNGRDTVMPFAPVMLTETLPDLFSDDTSRIYGSLDYMIMTLNYKDGLDQDRIGGVMHPYPLNSGFSGRPQIVDQHTAIGKILTEIESSCLINTSLNFHGKPIVFSIKDAVDDLKDNLAIAQKENLPEPVLVVGPYN